MASSFAKGIQETICHEAEFAPSLTIPCTVCLLCFHSSSDSCELKETLRTENEIPDSVRHDSLGLSVVTCHLFDACALLPLLEIPARKSKGTFVVSCHNRPCICNSFLMQNIHGRM